jgi:hypothetical protein
MELFLCKDGIKLSREPPELNSQRCHTRCWRRSKTEKANLPSLHLPYVSKVPVLVDGGSIRINVKDGGAGFLS